MGEKASSASNVSGCSQADFALAFRFVNHRRRGVHLEAFAFFCAGQRVAGRVRGRVGGDNLYLVAAVGNQRGVEAVGLVGDLILEQTPDFFAVAAQVERIDQVVAVVVVRGPADGDGGAILDGLQGAGWSRRRRIRCSGWSDGKAMLTVCGWLDCAGSAD